MTDQYRPERAIFIVAVYVLFLCIAATVALLYRADIIDDHGMRQLGLTMALFGIAALVLVVRDKLVRKEK